MTYEIHDECSEELREEIETTHDDLATEHGRDHVFVAADDGEVVSVVAKDIGLVEPIQIGVGDATSLLG